MKQSVLLAVSGGIDSVVMTHLFHRAGVSFAIGHCNFQLRGKASDGDQEFVARLAVEMEVPFHSVSFDTGAYADRTGVSLQMAARDLRYRWLEEMRQRLNLDGIATAHHLDDSAETLLLNLIRGTGLRGLHGILPRRERTIRPLLFAHKEEIEAFAEAEDIAFRVDSSNREVKYERNRIRHEIIPLLLEINPSFRKTAAETIDRMREAEWLYDYAIDIWQRKLVRREGEKEKRIDLQALLRLAASKTMLYEILRPYGFHAEQVGQILDSAESEQSGAIFHAPGGYRLLVDRNDLILEKESDIASGEVEVDIDRHTHPVPGGLLYTKVVEGRPGAFPDSNWRATLDLEALARPLKMRRWQEGDAFQPLGMKGRHQKIKDFLVRQKVDRFAKERIWLLVDKHDRICWVVGYRPDHRYRIRKDTERYIEFHYVPDAS